MFTRGEGRSKHFWRIIESNCLHLHYIMLRPMGRQKLQIRHDAILPMELVIPSLRIMKQHELSAKEYSEAMNVELEQLDESMMEALNSMIVQKKKITKAYNKKVKKRVFYEGQMVWKVILPLGIKDRELGKWSPSWEGPFKAHRILKGNAY
ncbi:uncharacterized protein LOC119979984 [Tripterygium wilfordii]|uniref:uncharacterized protein LOC119979984 n=1 Tax=Tripterygium wilfordii TaxID=458696 RepID=UPI0018F82919|nr:uncharacterized protein LOC119979984 [Tripterygium wilfordii]